MDFVNQDFIEEYDVALGLVEDTLISPSTGNNASWVSIVDFYSIVIVFISDGTGTSGADDSTINFEQAQNASGSGRKSVSIKDYYQKFGNQAVVGAEYSIKRNTPLERVSLTSAANSVTQTGSGQPESLFVTEIKATDLDINNNFKFLRITIDDTGTNAQRGTVYYIGKRRMLGGPDDSRRL